MYALAIDLGTTTLAMSLIDLNNRQRLAANGAMNPQQRFGTDVISRLNAAVNSEETLLEMATLIRTELLRLARQLCTQTGVAWSDVVQVAIAGNPAMQHILLNLPVSSLAFPPYRPLHKHGTRLTADELAWDGSAEVYLFPMPGGFVGGDTVAFLYGQGEAGTRRDSSKKMGSPSPLVPQNHSLFLDMGTNGEIALVTGETIWATSAAAGPAFEGGNLSCGMAALPGAISSAHIENGRVKIAVIGAAIPLGICGSATIELVCELLRHNIIELDGRLRQCSEIPSNLADRVINHNGETVFVIYRDAGHLLFLSQEDIRQIQLAKAALRAGIDVLLDSSRIHCQALRNVILTGSFGAVLQTEWLKTFGIFDKSMIHITEFIPEGVLAGVEQSLFAGDNFDSVEHLGERFRVVPLSGTPLFEKLFFQQINFPEPM